MPDRSEEWSLDRPRIEKLAGAATYARAWTYQRQGRVEGILRSGPTVAATVRGTVPYRVKLTAGPRPTWACDCPVGAEGKFCKHCAALAIELLDPADRNPLGRAASNPEPDLATTLSALSRDQLEEIVRLAAARDARVAQAVETAAAAAGGTGLDVGKWAKRIDTAFRTGGFVDYRAMPDWAAGVDEVLDGLRDLLASGWAEEVLGLLERAHRKLERAVGRDDDSNGEITAFSHLIADLHLQAATAARPAPKPFARRLAKLELDGDLDTFRRAAHTYAGVLGQTGLEEYARVVEPGWKEAMGDPNRSPFGRFGVTEAMIGLALAHGDPDRLLAVKADRMHTPADYLEVARAMESAGRRADAVQWARRGLDAVGTKLWPTHELTEFLATLLAAEGDREGADEVWWSDFAGRPSVESYRRLVAGTRGADPADVRERALALLRDKAGPAPVLVGILLYEDRREEAWQVASSRGVDDRTWMQVAAAREADHPLEVLPVYERLARARIETAKAAGYKDAVALLRRMEKLARAGERPSLFNDVVSGIVADHYRKPSLMEQLRRAGWL